MTAADLVRLRDVVERRNCLPREAALAVLAHVEALEQQVRLYQRQVAAGETDEELCDDRTDVAW